MSDGWRCPVCGSGVAPSEKRCDHGGGFSGVSSYPVRPVPVYPRYGNVTVGMYQCSCGVLVTVGQFHQCLTCSSGTVGASNSYTVVSNDVQNFNA